MTRLVSFIGLLSVVLVWICYKAASETSPIICPQGCRMSWMSPSYVLQDKFDKSWTRLSGRYSLWLYREVGWDSHELQGAPVLFIPGNAGSSHQVRSIASSATRQYFSSPSVSSPEFLGRNSMPLDFFALEFNEDLSAFHGPTLTAQTSYAHAAISYILSLYPENTTITVLGHSMGGIVSTSLLPNSRISTIITMSTPHTLPPARFDRRIESIYERNADVLNKDTTPILSICGGAVDMQVPSESCILELGTGRDVYRRTVFTTALEGAWTGVGHLASVWCHQVRWRVARVALELAALAPSSPAEKANVLDRWLPGADARNISDSNVESITFTLGKEEEHETLPEGMKLMLRKPTGSRTYVLPISSSSDVFTLYLSGGTLMPYRKRVHHLSSTMSVAVYLCTPSSDVIPETTCKTLQPTTLKLVPNPPLTQPFPLPDEGTDESEGLVMFNVELPATDGNDHIAVRVQEADGSGWLVAALENGHSAVNQVGWIAPFIGQISVPVGAGTRLAQEIFFPNLISNALTVYKVMPIFSSNRAACSATLLPPLLEHTSSAVETSYHPLALPQSNQILLHTYASAPYITTFVPSANLLSKSATKDGVRLSILSTNEHQSCKIESLDIRVDWWATIGQWAVRYWTAYVIWSVGIASILMFSAITESEETESVSSPTITLHNYMKHILPILLSIAFCAAIVPLPIGSYLGLGWHGLATGIIGGCIAMLLVIASSGLVAVIWFFLVCVIIVTSRLTLILGRPREDTSVRRNTVLSMCLVFVFIFFFVPWQVAFLGNWFIYIWVCATKPLENSGRSSSSTAEAVPLVARRSGETNSSNCVCNDNSTEEESDLSRQPAALLPNYNLHLHFLLLKTLLLPLVAPVLAVWVRTLYTAGLTTPFDGDHNFLSVAPWLILVDYASWARNAEFVARGPYEGLSMRWLFVVLATTALLAGPVRTFRVLDGAAICMTLVAILRIRPRYWGDKYSPLSVRM